MIATDNHPLLFSGGRRIYAPLHFGERAAKGAQPDGVKVIISKMIYGRHIEPFAKSDLVSLCEIGVSRIYLQIEFDMAAISGDTNELYKSMFLVPSPSGRRLG